MNVIGFANDNLKPNARRETHERYTQSSYSFIQLSSFSPPYIEFFHLKTEFLSQKAQFYRGSKHLGPGEAMRIHIFDFTGIAIN